MLQQQLVKARLQHDAILAALLEEAEQEQQRAPRRKRWWVRDWILRRCLFEQYITLLRELEADNSTDFKFFLRMEPEMFHEPLARVGPRIANRTRRRASLEPGLRRSRSASWPVAPVIKTWHSRFDSPTTPSRSLTEVCHAIFQEYKAEVWETPSTEDASREVAQQFQDKWSFPHCCGVGRQAHRHSEAVKERHTVLPLQRFFSL